MTSPLPPVDDAHEIADARKYIRRLRGFYQLLATAAIVIALSLIVNLATGGRWWVGWVVFGFAIAIAIDAVDTFGRSRWLGRDWQELKLREELQRRRGRT